MAGLLGRRRSRIIEDELKAYNERILACMDVLERTFSSRVSGVDRGALQDFYTEIHKAEGQADDIRREIEVSMYTQSLFPESRGDILGLLEAMDRVPNHAESSVRMVLIQHMQIPPEICRPIVDLVRGTTACVRAMIVGVEQLFRDFVSATATVGKIDQLESETDRMEEALIDTVFGGDWPDLTKIQLKDLIDHIAGISDRAEGVGDRIRIIVAKRGG